VIDEMVINELWRICYF